MLIIETKPNKYWNPDIGQFIDIKKSEIYRFEFSLLALSKWESVYQVFYFGNKELTTNQSQYMIQCMELDGKEVKFELLSQEDIEVINNYMNDKQSATTVTSSNDGNSEMSISSELLYGLMVIAGIPFEAETWHINRLQKLLAVIGNLKGEKTKVPEKEVLKSQHELNAERRKQLKSKG